MIPQLPKKQTQKSLRINYIFNFISQILTLVIPLITTPYLSRIFHEAGNGQLAFANNIVSYFTTLANLGYSIYGQREIAKHQDNKEEKSKIFWEIIIIRGLLSFLSISILLSLSLGNVFADKYKDLILLFSIQVIAVPFDIQFLYQGEEDFKSIAIRTLILRVLTLIFIFCFVKTEDDLWIYALCYSLSVILSNLIMWPPIKKYVGKIPLKELRLVRHFLPAFIIFLPTLAASIYGSLDKIMIGYLATNPDYENGCYEQSLKINQTVLVLVTVIDSVMIARNSHDFGVGDIDSLKKHLGFSINYVWMIGLPLIVGMCVLSNNLCSWFLGDGYQEAPMLLCIMSVRFIVSGFIVVFGNELFVVIGKEKYTTIAYAITGVVNLCLNFFFIPKYGATGAAITTAIAEFVASAILIIIALKKKYITIKSFFSVALKPLIAALIMFVPIYFANKYLSYSIWTFLLITLIGLLTYSVSLLLLKDKFFISAIQGTLNLIKSKFHKTKNK